MTNARPAHCTNPTYCKEPTVFRLVGSGIEVKFCVTCNQRFQTRAVDDSDETAPTPGAAHRMTFSCGWCHADITGDVKHHPCAEQDRQRAEAADQRAAPSSRPASLTEETREELMDRMGITEEQVTEYLSHFPDTRTSPPSPSVAVVIPPDYASGFSDGLKAAREDDIGSQIRHIAQEVIDNKTASHVRAARTLAEFVLDLVKP